MRVQGQIEEDFDISPRKHSQRHHIRLQPVQIQCKIKANIANSHKKYTQGNNFWLFPVWKFQDSLLLLPVIRPTAKATSKAAAAPLASRHIIVTSATCCVAIQETVHKIDFRQANMLRHMSGCGWRGKTSCDTLLGNNAFAPAEHSFELSEYSIFVCPKISGMTN